MASSWCPPIENLEPANFGFVPGVVGRRKSKGCAKWGMAESLRFLSGDGWNYAQSRAALCDFSHIWVILYGVAIKARKILAQFAQFRAFS
jgi:hypothetical protein